MGGKPDSWCWLSQACYRTGMGHGYWHVRAMNPCFHGMVQASDAKQLGFQAMLVPSRCCFHAAWRDAAQPYTCTARSSQYASDKWGINLGMSGTAYQSLHRLCLLFNVAHFPMANCTPHHQKCYNIFHLSAISQYQLLSNIPIHHCWW